MMLPAQVAPEVQYAGNGESASLMKVVRTIGVFLIVSGAMGLLGHPTVVLLTDSFIRWARGVLKADWGSLLEFFATIIVNLLAIGAGIMCLRSRPRGRLWILVWSYGSLGFSVYSSRSSLQSRQRSQSRRATGSGS